MSQAQQLYVSYDVWKKIAQGNNFTTYFHEDDGVGEQGSAHAGTDAYIFSTRIVDETWEDFNATFPSGVRVLVSRSDDAIANIVGTSNVPKTTATSDGVLRVSTEPAEGISINMITPNWCDHHTWYYNSVVHSGVVLSNTGDYTTYSGANNTIWVDNLHGRYSDEDTLVNENNLVPRLKVYVDGVKQTEQDPHTGLGGDYTVDYNAPSVTFNSALGQNVSVTADIYVVQSSSWVIKPQPGKKLKIKSVEAQFSRDVSLTDTLYFQTFGYVQVFAPHLWQGTGGPYPTNTLIPISVKIYKTMQDFINEANGAMPIIHPTLCASSTWRDLSVEVQTFPWVYQTVKTLISSYGMETHIFLEHDTPFKGSIATATIYCISTTEE